MPPGFFQVSSRPGLDSVSDYLITKRVKTPTFLYSALKTKKQKTKQKKKAASSVCTANVSLKGRAAKGLSARAPPVL